MNKKRDPLPSGEILLKESIAPSDITRNKLAPDVDVPATRIGDLVLIRRGMTIDPALRLAIRFWDYAGVLGGRVGPL